MPIKKLSPEILRQHKGISFTGVTTSFFCHDGHGKLFFTKRSNQTRDEHGRWDPGGGGLKHNQSLVDNTLREIKEEYDAVPINLEFLGYSDVFRTNTDGEPTHWLSMCFVAQINPDDIHINEPEMVDDYGWFTLDDLPNPLHSQFDVVMKKFGPQLREMIGENNTAE